MSNVFILSWDCTGIESVINMTEHEKNLVWAHLKDQAPSVNLNHVLNHLLLRARANPQRHYEIYTVQVQKGITDQDIRGMFEQDPQGSADLVREHGRKIYSDRFNDKERIIA